MVIDASANEIAEFTGVEITGTRSSDGSDFGDWLETIDVHAQVDMINDIVASKVNSMTPEEFRNSDAPSFKDLIAREDAAALTNNVLSAHDVSGDFKSAPNGQAPATPGGPDLP